jgi:hypothetical protein
MILQNSRQREHRRNERYLCCEEMTKEGCFL